MARICLLLVTKVVRRKSLVFLVLLLVFCSPALFAADNSQAGQPANSSGESLQQQLQTLQAALDSSEKASSSTSSAASTPIASTNPPSPTASPNNAAAADTLNPPSDITSPTSPASLAAASSDPVAIAQNVAALGEEEIIGNDIRSQAFGQMLTTTLPLSPAQIRMLHSMYDATQKAAAAYPGVPPRPTASSLVVNLSPGATPPIVRLGAGFITSLVFVDSTGAPWPIDSYSLGNPTAFNIQWDKKSNILLMQAITGHRMGNLAVILKGLGTPVMIDLHPGQAALDERVDLRVPGLGPQAKPTIDVLPGTESPALLALLDGIPPSGAKNLKSSACENCVWLADKKMYLRTQFVVLSPAWTSTLSSADGTHVYEMQPTPLVLASYQGKTIKMKIEGF